MDLARRLGLLLTMTAISLPGAILAAPEPEAEVPVGHWAYDAVTTLAKYGVATGRPDGWYRGKRPVIRRDFAETLCYILGDGERLEGEGALWTAGPKYRYLERLELEFRADLIARGAKPADIASGLERFKKVCDDPRPHGVTAPLPGAAASPLLANWPEMPSARNEGSDEALAAWAAGEVVLHSIGGEAPLRPNSTLNMAITLKPVADRSNRFAIQKALGHNAAMWKLLREKGPPDDARYGWLRRVFDLKRLAVGQKVLDLEPDGATTPEGAILLKPIHYVHGYALQANGRDLPLGFLDQPIVFGYRGYSVRWGESGTGVARFDVEFKFGRRTYAVDCRTGCILNAR